jgi:hypothetical protein
LLDSSKSARQGLCLLSLASDSSPGRLIGDEDSMTKKRPTIGNHMHAFEIAIWVAAASALIFGVYHYWVFNDKLVQAQMDGKIPSGLQMGIAWMIVNPGIVPGGNAHRRKILCAFGAFVALSIGYALMPS